MFQSVKLQNDSFLPKSLRKRNYSIASKLKIIKCLLDMAYIIALNEANKLGSFFTVQISMHQDSFSEHCKKSLT